MHRSTVAQLVCDAVDVTNILPSPNLVDVNWIVNCDQPTMTTTNFVDDTAYSSASTQSMIRTTVTDGYKFSAVRRMSQRLLPVKNAIFTYPTCTWSPLGVIQLEFHTYFAS